MHKTPGAIVVRYDLYRRPHTTRAKPIFVDSYRADDTTELFKDCTRAFKFDKTALLQFFNIHSFTHSGQVSKAGGLVVKVFSNCSPSDRIKAEQMRVDGIYEKNMTEDRKKIKEGCQKVLDQFLDLVNAVQAPRMSELDRIKQTLGV